jgi:Flp pilus assembly protein TadB
MISALIVVTGILAGLLIAVVWIDLPSWVSRPGGAASALRDSQSAADTIPASGLQRWIAPANAPVAKYAPAGMMRSMESDVYWAHFAGAYKNWTAGQFMTLRVLATAGALVAGLVLLQDPVISVFAAIAIWIAIPANVHSEAESVRKKIKAQLPEFVQLIAASMAAGVSLEESLVRAAQVGNESGRWVKDQVNASAGRMLIPQMQRAAQESRLTELITFAVQLGFVNTGTNQQELMDMMSNSMAQEYVSKANERAENVANSLSLQAGIFEFLPFIILIFVIMGGPLVAAISGQ